jgi:hypothetical protein
MVSLFWKIAFHIVLIVCIGKRELDATQKWRIFVIVRKANCGPYHFLCSVQIPHR